MKFINMKSYDPQVGTQINFDIYVKTSDVKVLLLFKAETVFNQEDVDRCKKYLASSSMFIKEEDYLSMFKKETDDLKASIESGGDLDSTAGTKIAKSFFKSEELLSGSDKLESMATMANAYVVDLLKSSKDQRTQTLVEMLKGLAHSSDEFITHANQVAAISTMIALMIENVSIDSIVEINLVSILHGMGLMVMSHQENEFFAQYADFGSFTESLGKTDQGVLQKVIEKHFNGHNKINKFR